MIVESCPNCGKDIEILEDEMEATCIGGTSIRVDAKAYCDDCEDTFFGSYFFNAEDGDFQWD